MLWLSFKEKLEDQDDVFNVHSALLFRYVRVVRMVDVGRNTLVDLVFSCKHVSIEFRANWAKLCR